MAAVALESSKGRQNFQRVTRLLIVGATKVGRETFDTISPPDTLDKLLADPTREAQLKKARMTRSQWNKVYPSPGKYGKSKDWDLTLIHRMLRSICGLSPPSTGWDDLPPDYDVSREADLVRLKYYRNSIYGHVDERMEIKDEEFHKLWKEISEAIIRLAGHLSSAKKNEWETAIEDFLTAPLTSDDMLNVEELQNWNLQDVKTRKELLQLKGDMSEIKGNMAEVKGGMAEVKGNMAEVKELIIKEIAAPKTRNLDVTSGTCFLLHHEDQPLEFFCDECGKCVCRTCVTLLHRSHTCHNINNHTYMQTVTQELLETCEKVRGKIEKHRNLIERIQKNGALRNDKLDKVKHEVKSAVENWIGQLREQEQKITKDIETTQTIYRENDESQMRELEKHVEDMKTSMRYTEKLASDASAVNKVTQKEQAVKCSNEYLNMELQIEHKTISGCQLKLNQNLTPSIVVSLWDCVAEGDSLRRSTVGVSSRFTVSTIAVSDTSRSVFYYPTLTVNVTIQSDYGDVSHVTHDNKDGTYIVSFTPLQTGDHQISVIVDGQIVSQYTCIAKAKQCIFTGDGLRNGTVGLKSQLHLTFRDPPNEKIYYPGTTVNVKIQSPQGNVIPAIHDNKDGVYNVSFVPAHPGDHKISATIDGESTTSCTYVVKVKKSILDGDGLVNGIVGLRSQFTVGFSGAGDEKLYDPTSLLHVNIHSPEGTFTPIIKDNKDGTYHVSFFPVRSGDYRISVTVQNKPSVNEREAEEKMLPQELPGSPFTASVKAREFRPVLTFGKKGSGKEEFDSPCGVAVNTKDEIIVADTTNNRVQMFSCRGEHLRTIGRKGTGTGEFDQPFCVVSDKNNNIIVADTINSRIQVFSETGEFLFSFGSKGDGKGQLEDPWGLSMDSESNIIVTDMGNNRIQLFSNEGEWLQSFDCGDHGDRYFVSILSEQCIKVFDKSGNFLSKYGEHGSSPGEFICPVGLAVDKASHLVVCDSLNQRLQVLGMDGSFVVSFGDHGKQMGQFCNPYAVAVMANGNLVVCDTNNNRVQIFE